MKVKSYFTCEEYEMLMENWVGGVYLATDSCSALRTGPPQKVLASRGWALNKGSQWFHLSLVRSLGILLKHKSDHAILQAQDLYFM